GKSSLALGILYAEGSRRYLESLSTYTRRRMTQAAKADVDAVRYIPAALALHQRPGVPGIRSTFGTGTELLNSLRLMFSRLASHRCPNGHYLQPSLKVAAEQPLYCPECGAKVTAPGAEDLAFNSRGACPTCSGTGVVRLVDEASLVPDEELTIDEGAVLPWKRLMWSLMPDVARQMGVRTDVPFKDLTPEEKEIVFHGPAVKKRILVQNKKQNSGGYLDFTYFNAVYTVENSLSKVKDEKGMKRVAPFLKEQQCPDCGGSRLSEAARAPRIKGKNLAQVCQLTLSEADDWVKELPDWLPEAMRPMARSICQSFTDTAKRLLDLGLGYLSLDRAAATLSTGERQRMQLARAVRNQTTGVLYILDEPSIGLHPANLKGLNEVTRELVADGNSVVLVDHDVQVLAQSDWMVEMGPQAGEGGGKVIATGRPQELAANPNSVIGKFLGGESRQLRQACPPADMFAAGKLEMQTGPIHTVKPLKLTVPLGRLSAVTGVSGSGKSTMVLESLLPAIQAQAAGTPLPDHVKSLASGRIKQAKLIDASPIGINVRSTVATYAGIHDDLRRTYAKLEQAKKAGCKAGDFSYNTGRLRCPECDGTGTISLDVQFLPDVDIVCPACRGSRYSKEAAAFKRKCATGEMLSLPDLMEMPVDQALKRLSDLKPVARKLQTLHDLGLGYLTLGEQTPLLSGGEAQRLKLASEMTRGQEDTLFVFDEPTIGLHPLDVATLIRVFQHLLDQGATLIVIEHDLDLIRNADWIVDLGPGGGEEGGRIVAAGTPEEIRKNPASITGRYL
ncbi:excinuclease ABC subunit UvrA, partial [Lactobacillus nasalidis]|uniref:excinuclease ABC subunit UvrA n=1 Tax=Lactobacillus nasalidis TaxID=2797258 RepID=UPI001915CF29